MNVKLILFGGLAFFVASWVVGMGVSGPLIHDGVLKEAYLATADFWRPELRQQPPDMAALMPLWIPVGLATCFIIAGIYGAVRSSFVGAGWKRGLKYGFVLALLTATTMAGWSGVFNLPYNIWAWWGLDMLVANLVGGLALGWVADLKFVGGESAASATA